MTDVSGRIVVVVGDVATDVVARYDGPLHLGSDSAAVVATYGGGSAANVAAWLAAHTGVAPVLVARIGPDPAGRAQAEELSALGVDVRFAVDSTLRTGCVVVLVNSLGERTMLPDRGANAVLSAADLPPEVFAPGAHLHLSGYPLLHETSRPAALSALALARDARLTISVDPSSVAPLQAVGAARFLEWTHGLDLCIANLDEARALVGSGVAGSVTAQEIARHLASSSYREVVIKLGADGAIWSDGDAVIRVLAHAAKVIDTTGAGDAFAAGFLGVWTSGGTPEKALAVGTKLAAAAVATAGGRP